MLSMYTLLIQWTVGQECRWRIGYETRPINESPHPAHLRVTGLTFIIAIIFHLSLAIVIGLLVYACFVAGKTEGIWERASRDERAGVPENCEPNSVHSFSSAISWLSCLTKSLVLHSQYHSMDSFIFPPTRSSPEWGVRQQSYELTELGI